MIISYILFRNCTAYGTLWEWNGFFEIVFFFSLSPSFSFCIIHHSFVKTFIKLSSTSSSSLFFLLLLLLLLFRNHLDHVTATIFTLIVFKIIWNLGQIDQLLFTCVHTNQIPKSNLWILLIHNAATRGTKNRKKRKKERGRKISYATNVTNVSPSTSRTRWQHMWTIHIIQNKIKKKFERSLVWKLSVNIK